MVMTEQEITTLINEPSTLTIAAAAFILGAVISWLFTTRLSAETINHLAEENENHKFEVRCLEAEVTSLEEMAKAHGWIVTNLEAAPTFKVLTCPLCGLPLENEELFHSKCSQIENWVNESFDTQANNLPGVKT